MNSIPSAGQVDCVLFDLYGTLVDIELDEESPPLWTGLTEALRSGGAHVVPAGVRDLFRSIVKEEAARGREGFIMERAFRRLMTACGVNGDVEAIGRRFRQLSLKTLTLRPFVAPLLFELRRSGTTTGIVSNTEAVLTRFDLDCFPVLLTVGTIVLSSAVGVRKPDPRIFLLALERLHSQAKSALFIGNDWAADIVGARGAGLRAIFVERLEGDRAVASEIDDAVVRAAPTLDAILSALRACGWDGAAH
jgi:putative hydrolase of the HAD superfamily